VRRERFLDDCSDFGVLRLTEAGRTALGAAEEMARVAAGLVGRLGKTEDGAVRGTVRLTAPQWLAERLLLLELPALRAQHPRLEVQLLGTNAVLDLTRLEADLALRNVKPNHLSLIARKVGSLCRTRVCLEAVRRAPRAAHVSRGPRDARSARVRGPRGHARVRMASRTAVR
jgi:DNA-binding transcriptional LysR family regulator